jgi:hypothetical protein
MQTVSTGTGIVNWREVWRRLPWEVHERATP